MTKKDKLLFVIPAYNEEEKIGKVLKEIIICGLRGFSAEKKVNFAIPNGEKGSGLTILVGGNNTGKTTIIEAIKYKHSFAEITYSLPYLGPFLA